MDKIILVYYAYFGDPSQLYRFSDKIEEFHQIINKDKTEDMIQYIIPVSKFEDTRVECINPKLVNEEDYKEVKQLLDRAKEKLNNFLNQQS